MLSLLILLLEIYVLLSTGKGSSPNSISINDFNHDSRFNFVITNTDYDSIGVFLGFGDGSFSQQITCTVESFSFPIDTDFSDFDHDNCLDIVVALVDVHRIAHFLMKETILRAMIHIP